MVPQSAFVNIGGKGAWLIMSINLKNAQWCQGGTYQILNPYTRNYHYQQKYILVRNLRVFYLTLLFQEE